jgi:hypothetical protein
MSIAPAAPPEEPTVEPFGAWIEAQTIVQAERRKVWRDPLKHWTELERALVRRLSGRTRGDIENSMAWRRHMADASNYDQQAATHEATADEAAKLIKHHQPYAKTSTYDADAVARAKQLEQDSLAAASLARQQAAEFRARAEATRTRGERAYRHYAAAIQDRRVLMLDPTDATDAELWADKGFRGAWMTLARGGYLASAIPTSLAIASPPVDDDEPELDPEPITA